MEPASCSQETAARWKGRRSSIIPAANPREANLVLVTPIPELTPIPSPPPLAWPRSRPLSSPDILVDTRSDNQHGSRAAVSSFLLPPPPPPSRHLRLLARNFPVARATQVTPAASRRQTWASSTPSPWQTLPQARTTVRCTLSWIDLPTRWMATTTTR